MNFNQVSEKAQKWEFLLNITIISKIAYASDFDSSVCPHRIFWWCFANSSKLLKNKLIAENLNQVHWQNLFWKIGKVPSNNSVWSNCWIKTSSVLAYFKNSCKSTWREIVILVFSSLSAICRADPHWACWEGSMQRLGTLGAQNRSTNQWKNHECI